MKRNPLLLVCLLLTLFTGYKSYGQTATYNITSLVGSTLNTGCGYTQVFNNGSNSAIGFSWVDGIPAGSTITGVTIYYCVGVNEIISGGGTFPSTLNGNNIGSTTYPYQEYCIDYIGTYSVAAPPADYVVGGTNTFLITPIDSYFGYIEYLNNNPNTLYGQVVVSYTAACSSGCNLGVESNPGTPAAAQCSPTWAFAADCGPGATVAMPAGDVLANTYYDFQVSTGGGLYASNSIYVGGNCTVFM